MKSVFRMTIVLVLLAALAGAAQADVEPVFCGELAAEDCALLQTAQENALQQSSGTMTMDLDFTMRDIPDMLPGEHVISMDVAMRWSGDPEALMRLEGLQAATLPMYEPAQMVLLLEEMLEGLNGEVNMTLHVPAALLEHEDSPFDFSTDIRLVDSVAWLNVADIVKLTAELTPGDSSFTGQLVDWIGIDIPKWMQHALEEAPMEEPMRAPDQSSMMKEMEELAATWSDHDFLTQFVIVERLADRSVNNQAAAVFQTRVDLNALLRSAEFHALLGSLGEMGGSMSLGDMGEMEEMDEGDMQAMVMMLVILTQGIEIETREFIRLDDPLPLREEARMAWDLAALQAFAEDATDMEGALSLDTRVDYHYPEAVEPVTAPENGILVSPETMMQTGADV